MPLTESIKAPLQAQKRWGLSGVLVSLIPPHLEHAAMDLAPLSGLSTFLLIGGRAEAGGGVWGPPGAPSLCWGPWKVEGAGVRQEGALLGMGAGAIQALTPVVSWQHWAVRKASDCGPTPIPGPITGTAEG